MGDEVKKYNEFFKKNYVLFKKHCIKYNIEEDVLHETYIRVLRHVKKYGFNTRGYNDKGFYYFVLRSVNSEMLNSKNTSYLNRTVYIVDNLCEDELNSIFEDDSDDDVNRIKSQYITRKLFFYLKNKIKISELELAVFKIYYLSKSKMTYKKINEIYGINNNKINTTIRKIKKELRTNFVTWLEDEYRRDYKDIE